MERNGGNAPNTMQAGFYGEALRYLKAIEAAGTDKAKAAVAQMKKIPIEDFYAHGALVREDGRVLHDMYVMQTKTRAESKPFDYYELLSVNPGKDAFRPLNERGCPFVKIAADTGSIRACRFASAVRLRTPIAPTISFVGMAAATAFRETLQPHWRETL